MALLFGVYVSERLPIEVRLRASEFVNMLRRGATIVTPFLVVMLFQVDGVADVMALTIGLLLIRIITVATLCVETRDRRLEELKEEVAAPVIVRQMS